MRIPVILAFYLMLIFPAFSQVSDDFSSTWPNSVWNGEVSMFTVSAGQLESVDTIVGDTFYISAPLALSAAMQWECKIDLNFNTSSQNYVDLVLVSDQSNLEEIQNGWFVRIGNTNDEIALYKMANGSSVKMIDGADGSTNSGSVSLQLRVTCSAGGEWALERRTLSASNWVNEGIVSAPLNIVNGHTGLRVKQSTPSFFGKHGFDDFYAGGLIADTIAPSVTDVMLISSDQVILYFTEPLFITQSENQSNYLLQPADIHPIQATWNANDYSVLLQFSSGVLGTSFSLQITGLEDVSGNVLDTIISGLQYVETFAAVPGDLFITEVMADPSPVVSLPEIEYVELHNSANHAINLSGCQFVNTTTAKVLPDAVLLPGDFVILCAQQDTSLLSAFGKVLGITSWPVLANTGDSLTLVGSSGEVLDIFVYSLSTYQNAQKDEGGYSLERAWPPVNCSGVSLWAASDAVVGGTPGAVNSVIAGSSGSSPKLEKSDIPSLNEIVLQFDQPVNPQSANVSVMITSGYGGAYMKSVTQDGLQIRIQSEVPFAADAVLTVSISGLFNCPQTGSLDTAVQISYGQAPKPYQLLMTEIFANPEPELSQLPDAEFLELTNVSTEWLRIDNCTLSDATSDATFPAVSVAPGERIILTAVATVGVYEDYGEAIGVAGFPSLNNAGDSLVLKNASGDIIHYVHYTDDWYRSGEKAQGGWSIELMDPKNPCGESANWRASEDPMGGTPGRLNSVAADVPDTLAPHVSEALVIGQDAIRITLNELVDPVSLFTVGADITPAIGIQSISVYGDRSLDFMFGTELQEGKIYTILLTGIKDCLQQTEDLYVPVIVPARALANEIVVNEILFNPLTGGSDFIELHNVTNRPVSLHNWRLIGQSGDTIQISDPALIINAGEYLVLTESMDDLMRDYPGGVRENMNQVYELPKFPDDAGSIAVLNDLGEEIDGMSYDQSMHYPLLESVEGVSIERIHATGGSDDRTNWHSAASNVGFATPGYKNSQAGSDQVPAGDVSLTSEIFSPDNDGMDDYLTIAWKFEKAGNSCSFAVYNANGVLVRNLASAMLVSTEGSVQWDGTDQDGYKVPIGIYIVFADVFNPEGHRKRHRLSCAVAGKM